ncbi:MULTISPECIES: MBL fold metallo-hydrolase [Streptomyces]|uniref:MBL fold metallo-hydrolase n=2 Tax=Streptomyces TaxID=1883 RepID=A0ABW6YSM6_9ACTN|nr:MULTISPECIES: MBL fold metallo-hydrolase [Streptomyces]MCL3994503.1 MBL fold metallo-hydrolase [Streptomyces lavenduligriseus]QIS69128.1 MBL fold metallo-hydrolase [Streptomyces sp. DSM 40868]
MVANSALVQDDRLRRPAGIRSVRLGDTKVSFVPDGAVQGRPRAWLPDTTEETWTAHPEYLDASGYLVASIGGLLVEQGDRALLIDPGFGPRSLPADPDTPNGALYGGALLDSLAELGRGPEEIEAVAFSHLHPDHIGWAVHPVPDTGRLAFAHADHFVPAPEWATRDLPEAAGGLSEEIVTALAPRVRTVTDGQEIFPGVRVRITAGHTAGHAEYVITGGGSRLIAFGDSLHSPIQVDHPEWSSVHDQDPVRAADHRRRLVAELAEPGTIGFGVHFADVVFGRVRRGGDGPAWQPLEA